jgi:nucleoside-diphosphate-sugar epimerase
MKKKIILIGKSSFIGNSLFYYLKEKFRFKVLSLSEFLLLNNTKIRNIDWIINCSIGHNYIKKNYKEKNDFDLKIAKKILPLKTKYIFLSSRKIYKSSNNINEQSKISPKCNYSKNKVITEKKLFYLLKDRLLILRISNLIGLRKARLKKKNVHKIFIDHFFDKIKKGLIFKNNKIYKDFLSTQQFSKVVERLIKKNITGVYNVSIGKKVYLKNLIEWLNYYNRGKYMYVDLPKNYEKDCFYLNNSKILKKINLNLNLADLEKYCKKISKIFFKK